MLYLSDYIKLGFNPITLVLTCDNPQYYAKLFIKEKGKRYKLLFILSDKREELPNNYDVVISYFSSSGRT